MNLPDPPINALILPADRPTDREEHLRRARLASATPHEMTEQEYLLRRVRRLAEDAAHAREVERRRHIEAAADAAHEVVLGIRGRILTFRRDGQAQKCAYRLRDALAELTSSFDPRLACELRRFVRGNRAWITRRYPPAGPALDRLSKAAVALDPCANADGPH